MLRTTSPKSKKRQTLIEWQPTACLVRQAGYCHVCKSRNLVSYLLPEFERRHYMIDGELYEDCGYFCCGCGWANAGGRPTEIEEW